MNTSPTRNHGRGGALPRALAKPLCLGVLICALPRIAPAETTVGDTRAALEKWVETRQQISKTRSDWQADKESLEQTVALYERELKSVEEQMSKVSTNNTQVAKEAAEAEALKQTSAEAIERARSFAVGFEARLKQVVPQLPAPLQDLVKPLVARMPADPQNTRMLAAERVQVCVGVLNELDKFNNAVNVFNEKRKNDKGDEVAVQTLYVGLGAAYFVNDTADFAGAGAPGAAGWQWSNQPELAPTIQAALKIYRNEQTARFLTLPVTIK
jgi:septal ring factor EnvC (AmiA/AmiB activator)